MLLEFALLRPFEFALEPVFEHWVAVSAVAVDIPEARKIVITINEMTFKLSSLLWFYVTRVITTIVIFVYVELDELKKLFISLTNQSKFSIFQLMSVIDAY